MARIPLQRETRYNDPVATRSQLINTDATQSQLIFKTRTRLEFLFYLQLSRNWNYSDNHAGSAPAGQASLNDFVADLLRLLATIGVVTHAATANRNSWPAAIAFRRTRNPHDRATPRHSERDGNSQQTSGCGPDSAQGAKN